MFKREYIKRTAAAFLLMVFAFSITPTIVFHNWLADHTDTVRKATCNETEQVGKQTFNCNCYNIVAESPFTETADIILPVLRPAYNLFKGEKPDLFFPSPVILHALRGPPVV